MFLDDLATLAQSRLPLGRQRTLPQLADEILRREARQVKRGRKAQSREEADMHQLRIALKKLRYTAEFFASLYPKKKAGRYLKKVRRLQENLGDLNDIAHVRSTVTALMGPEGDIPAAVHAGSRGGPERQSGGPGRSALCRWRRDRLVCRAQQPHRQAYPAALRKIPPSQAVLGLSGTFRSATDGVPSFASASSRMRDTSSSAGIAVAMSHPVANV